MEARAVNQPPMAQLPFSVFLNRDLAGSVTLTGTDTDWKSVSVIIGPTYHTNFFLKIFFAQSGLELRNIRLIMTEDMEEKIRNILEAIRATDRGNGDPF